MYARSLAQEKRFAGPPALTPPPTPPPPLPARSCGSRGRVLGCSKMVREAEVELRMQSCVRLCGAASASASAAASASVEVDAALHWLLNELCDGKVAQQVVSDLIWAGASGSFAEACLVAQGSPWSAAHRLRIVENSVGLLDNCREYEGLLGLGSVERLLRGLIALEESLCVTASAEQASGVLESYGLVLLRLLLRSPAETAARLRLEAADVLVEVLKRRDLLAVGRSEAVRLLCLLVKHAPSEAQLENVSKVLFEESQANLEAASPYLRCLEAWAGLAARGGRGEAAGDGALLLEAFDCIRDVRRRSLERRAEAFYVFRHRHEGGATAAREELAATC